MSDESNTGMAAETVVLEDKLTKEERVLHAEQAMVKPAVADCAKPKARVRVALGVTVNMLNYQSIRVDVSAEVPTPVEKMKLAEVYLEGFVEKRLQALVDRIPEMGEKWLRKFDSRGKPL